MNIQKVQQFNMNQKQQPNFTGVGDAAVTALRFLDTNQAIGACAVDLGCMVIPRTLTDFTRGADAGFETMRRESTGTINHAAIGPVYGTLAGMLVSTAINSKYGINATNVFADAETIEMLSKMQFDNVKANKGVEEFAEQVVKGIKTSDGKILSGKSQTKIKQILKDTITGEKHTNIFKDPYKTEKSLIRNIVLSDLGTETKLKLGYSGKEITASLNDMIDNITSLSRTLFKEKVVDSFKHADSFADVNFVKAMKNFCMRRSLLGLGIGAAVGCSIQPLNIYLTKKKTGSDGFVGVEGREKDNSKGFKALKLGAAASFVAFALATIGKPQNLLKNIQYKSLIPTLDQFKLVYGLTIASRLVVARDKDELRESLIKDTLGFSTWLLLGNFVAKGTLKGLSKFFAKKGKELNILGKTRDEVLHAALKDANISTVKDGKALSFKELRKLIPTSDSLTRLKLKCFDIAQLAGYAFSAIVLGVGIPKLNIYMTNKSEQKRAQQRAMNPQMNMFKPENLAFLSKEMNFTANRMLNK